VRRDGRLTLGLVLLGSVAHGADLGPETAKAWDQYVESVRAKTQARAAGAACFLWADESADRVQRLRRGEVVVSPAAERTPRPIPGGLIHHWVGAVFLPGVSLAAVRSSMRNFDRYKEYYSNVVDSKYIGNDGHVDQFTAIEKHDSLFSRFALDADSSAYYTKLDDKRGYGVSYTTRLQQIQNYGEPGQYKLEPYSPKAYVWRLTSITRYEERDGGVYMEVEAIALSRDISASLRWLVDRFIRQAASGAMTASLQQTRLAVLGHKENDSNRGEALEKPPSHGAASGKLRTSVAPE
jgi:hypothetical protein